jgi:GldM C-terminal domain
LYVTTDNGTITGSNGIYVCKPSKVGRALITVSVKKGGKLKWLGSLPFRVKYLNDEYNTVFKVAYCGNGCSIPKNVLAAQEYVRVELLQNIDIDVRFRVDSFSVCIISSGSNTSTQIKNIGNRITTSVKEAFAALKDGDMVLFKEIYTKWPDGRSVQIKPVVMFVRE